MISNPKTAVSYNDQDKTMQLKVMTLNVWGTPAMFIKTKDKKQRLNAIGDMMKRKEYHVYLLQEVFYYKDYKRIQKRLKNAGLYVTGVLKEYQHFFSI